MKKTIYFILFFSVLFNMIHAQSDFENEVLKYREIYKNDFLKEARSPLQEKDLDKLRFYPPKAEYVVNTSFQPTPNAEVFDMATYSGITKKYVQYGWLKFELNGQKVKLAVYQSLRLRAMPKYQDYLFLPFKDYTNGETTYGGGRYIDLKRTDIIGNKMKLDFNRAYNPWCAFADGYNCPIPPTENHMKIAVEAGEKKYAGKTK